MFTPLIETLAEKGRGIHAYGTVARLAFDKASAHPEAAVAFFLLGKIAEDFVDLHERMPLTTRGLDAFYDRYSAAVQSLQTAQDTGDAQAQLAALNAVAAQAVQPGFGATEAA